jgi:hypothetical protein
MSSRRIVYVSHSDSTREAQASALANVYRYILNRPAKQEATCPGSPDDAKGLRHDSRHSKYTG